MEAEAPFADEMSRAFRDGDPDRAVALLAPMKAAARAAQVARLAAKKNEGAKARTGENRRTDANLGKPENLRRRSVMGKSKERARPECPLDGQDRQPAASESEIVEIARRSDAAMRGAAEDCEYAEADVIGRRLETYLDGLVDMAAVCGCGSLPLRRLMKAWTASRRQDAPFDALREAMGWPS